MAVWQPDGRIPEKLAVLGLAVAHQCPWFIWLHQPYRREERKATNGERTENQQMTKKC